MLHQECLKGCGKIGITNTRESTMATAKKVAVKKTAAPKKAVQSVQVETHHVGVDWRSLYLYAVCLITLLVVLFSTVSLINSIMNAVFQATALFEKRGVVMQKSTQYANCCTALLEPKQKV